MSRLLALLPLLAALTACAQPAERLAESPLPRALPPVAPPCPLPELPDESGACRPAEDAVVGPGGRVFWVDAGHPAADDANAGTRDRPWRTIGRAARAGALRPGDGVLVRAGLYRETVEPESGGTGPGRRVTFAAYPGEAVVVTGAEPLGGPWTRSGDAWQTTWERSLRAYAGDLGHVMRRELLIAGGSVLRPDFGAEPLAPGSFRPVGPDSAVAALLVRLDRDAHPASASLEAAERTVLFAPLDPANRYAPCGSPGQPEWLRLVGFTFRHAANRAQWGAVCAGSAHALVEDVTVEWTNGMGFDTSGREHVFRRTRALDNGQLGYGGRCTSCLFEDNEASRNNWKGYDPFWEAGGGKWTHTEDTVFRRHRAYDNDGPGLWLDIRNHRNRIEDGEMARNLGAGVMLELETTGTFVTGNRITGTRWAGWTGTGLLAQAASDSHIEGNVIEGNEGTGLWLRLDPERRAEDGRHAVLGNRIVGNAARADVEAREVSVEGETIEHARTNRIEGNTYGYIAPGSLRSTFFVRPEPGNPAHYRGSDVARWEALVGARGERLADRD